LRHAENYGKGAALKTGIAHVLNQFPQCAGVVTADADGQHHPEDIANVAAGLSAEPAALVLGARAFGNDVPLRSRFGNLLTRRLLGWISGQRLTDTQTGLRAIPRALFDPILQLPSRGYEFELEMLLTCKEHGVPISERKIRTIYIDNNRSSSFRPVRDSLRIYFVLFRYTIVSLLTALLDNAVFWAATGFGAGIGLAQILARCASVVFQYGAVRNAVFRSNVGHRHSLPRYLCLVAGSGAAAYLLISVLHLRYGVGVMRAKIAVESGLFFINFLIQRSIVFATRKRA
jgi:putative flippase GtrA